MRSVLGKQYDQNIKVKITDITKIPFVQIHQVIHQSNSITELGKSYGLYGDQIESILKILHEKIPAHRLDISFKGLQECSIAQARAIFAEYNQPYDDAIHTKPRKINFKRKGLPLDDELEELQDSALPRKKIQLAMPQQDAAPLKKQIQLIMPNDASVTEDLALPTIAHKYFKQKNIKNFYIQSESRSTENYRVLALKRLAQFITSSPAQRTAMLLPEPLISADNPPIALTMHTNNPEQIKPNTKCIFIMAGKGLEA